MSVRVYWETLKKKWKQVDKYQKAGAGVIPVAMFAFAMLSVQGAITITGHSGDTACAGTQVDPCVAVVNFTANEDVFLYKTDYDPYGRNTSLVNYDTKLEDWKLYRSWGDGWREIPLDEGCTGTWCGMSPGDDRERAEFAYAFREGRNYTVKIEAFKENPEETVKWTWGSLDPYWYGVSTQAVGDGLTCTLNQPSSTQNVKKGNTANYSVDCTCNGDCNNVTVYADKR